MVEPFGVKEFEYELLFGHIILCAAAQHVEA